MRIPALYPLACIAIAFLSLQSCILGGDDPSPPTHAMAGNTFNHFQLKFIMQCPPTWEHLLNVDFNGENIDLVVRNTPEQGFAANAVVLQSPSEGITDMQAILDLYRPIILQHLPGARILSETVFERDGVSIAKVAYTGTIYGLEMKVSELLFVRNNRDVQIVFSDRAAAFDARSEFTFMESSLHFQ